MLQIETGKRYNIKTVHTINGVVEEFTAKVTSVKDCGDFYYIGFTPDDIRYGRFGYTRVKKVGGFKMLNKIFTEIK